MIAHARIATSLLLLAVLAACGADGAPQPPSDPPEDTNRVETGITISGSVGVGVAGSNTDVTLR